MVPFAAGGYVDGFARIFTDRLGALLGKAVIVENKPGAGGKIGDDYVASARRDGLTLLIDDVTRPVLTTLTNPDVAPNELLDNFALAGMLGYSPIILTAAPALGVKDFASLIAMVKAAPGKYSYGSPGPGTPSHVVSAQIVRLFGLDVVHVPGRRGDADGCRKRNARLDGQHAEQRDRADRRRQGRAVGRNRRQAPGTTPRRAEARGTRLSAIYWRGREHLSNGAGRNARRDPRPAQ